MADTVCTSKLAHDVSSAFPQLTKKDVKDIIVAFIGSIEDALFQSSKVRLHNIGILQVKDSAPRKGRNPQTGAEIKIEASKKVAFRASKSLKSKINPVVQKAAKKKK